MSLHPAPVPSATTLLESAAFALLAGAPGPGARPELVGVLAPPEGSGVPREPVAVPGPGTPDARGGLVLVELHGHDPAAELLGFVAPSTWWALGIVTSARAHPLDRSGPVGGATFVHLLDRSGTSISLLEGPDHQQVLTDGPDPQPAIGRLADACRRALGLATAPPPADMVTHVLDLWLARVVRSAVDRPGLDWPEVVARNPAHELSPCATVPTPAALARRSVELGHELDWERYRRTCVDAGGTPFGELDADAAAWMDAGMFARWMLGESLPRAAQIELLDALLTPGASDRLHATLALCPPPCWPPT